MIDLKSTIISQYKGSPAILSLLESINTALDPNSDIQAFYFNAFNILTASGWGLDNWGRIIGLSRSFKLPEPVADDDQFGYITDVDPQEWFGFDQAPFRLRLASYTGYISLDDDSYRQLLLLKAASNISNSSVPNINRILNELFKKRCYVLEVGTMTIRYCFDFVLSDIELEFMKSMIIPRPAGVGVQILSSYENFGFASESVIDNFYVGFDQGTFYGGLIYV